MKKLNPVILDYLVNKTGKTENTIRKDISLARRLCPNCTINAAAQLFALKNGLSVRQKLDREDKLSLPNTNYEIEKISVVKVREKKQEKRVPKLIDYESKEYFIKGHVEEANKAYTYGCYTAAFFLVRKIVENLIIDILRVKFPEESSRENKELYYDLSKQRLQDFGVVLKKLYEKRIEFGINGKDVIERLYPLVKALKDDTNDKVHSYYHLVQSVKEFDDISITLVFELIKRLESIIGSR